MDPSISSTNSPLFYMIPFILSQYASHLSRTPSSAIQPLPLIIGLNGVQGIGKSTIVSRIASILREENSIETLVLSIDDFYLRREDQVKLAEKFKTNPLVQFRGVPGTHDTSLLSATFESLLGNNPTYIPSFDKSLHHGQGDRVPQSSCQVVNTSRRIIQIIILEGWCIGFRPPRLSMSTFSSKISSPNYRQEDLDFMDEKLKDYELVWDMFDAFVHLDPLDLNWVYEWREEAEEKNRKEKGNEFTMNRKEIRRFVDGYMPAYEKYMNGVREGIWRDSHGKIMKDMQNRQLRIVIERHRNVAEVLKF